MAAAAAYPDGAFGCNRSTLAKRGGRKLIERRLLHRNQRVSFSDRFTVDALPHCWLAGISFLRAQSTLDLSIHDAGERTPDDPLCRRPVVLPDSVDRG